MLLATLPGEAAVRLTLSDPRFATYMSACGGDAEKAVALYGWNAAVSSALVLPAHFAEVSIRNAACDALTAVYGPRWPWDQTFERSLPSPRGPVYRPRVDLTRTRSRETSAGKVVAELKLAFWCSLYTSRHVTRLWQPYIQEVLPEAPGRVNDIRGRVRANLDQVRRLRNRIAHHEPVFARDIADDLKKSLDLTGMRSSEVAGWVRGMETVSQLLRQRP